MATCELSCPAGEPGLDKSDLTPGVGEGHLNTPPQLGFGLGGEPELMESGQLGAVPEHQLPIGGLSGPTEGVEEATQEASHGHSRVRCHAERALATRIVAGRPLRLILPSAAKGHSGVRVFQTSDRAEPGSPPPGGGPERRR